MQTLVENCLEVLDKRMKMFKVYNDNNNNDNGRILIKKKSHELRCSDELKNIKMGFNILWLKNSEATLQWEWKI